jgi:hypothetical protein
VASFVEPLAWAERQPLTVSSPDLMMALRAQEIDMRLVVEFGPALLATPERHWPTSWSG